MTLGGAAAAAWWSLGLGWVGYFLIMAIRGLSSRARRPGASPLRHWILVPCRNEEMVLARTLQAVTELAPERSTVVVIDDGSTDRTAEIAMSFESVIVVRRAPPEAGRGKGAALNAGFAAIADALHDSAVVGVIDADGRIDAGALDAVDAAMADLQVGAVQLSVRIGNRRRLLGRFQDLEFVSFSHLMQAARRNTGTVGLGGNGQFVRAGVLRGLGPDPWSDCLTEDLDLGLRLAAAGWKLELEDEASVTQQGVDSVSALIRQRARWLQGHIQCWRHLGPISRAALTKAARADLLAYLLSPLVLIAVGVMWCGGIGLAAWNLMSGRFGQPGDVSGMGYAVRAGLTLVPCLCLAAVYRRRSGDSGIVASTLLAAGLLVYNFIWCAALVLAFWRHVRRRNEWVKTARVPELTC